MGALNLKTAIRRRVSPGASPAPWSPDEGGPTGGIHAPAAEAPRAGISDSPVESPPGEGTTDTLAPALSPERRTLPGEATSGTATATPRTPAPAAAKIGPNSLIQTFAAITEFEGEEMAGGLRALLQPPEALDDMVDQAHFIRLVRGLRRILPPASVDRILERAGERTADYVLRNRIPAPARFILPRLPRALALPLVLSAFRRNAWTFAGSARYRADAGTSGEGDHPHIELDGCITCVGSRRGRPGGAFYRGAFQGLLSALVAPGTRVTEDECVATGGRTCRYTIHLPGRPHREVSVHIATPEVEPCA